MKDMKIYLAAVMGAANATIAPFDFSRTLRGFEQTLANYQDAATTHFDFADTRLAMDELSSVLSTFAEYTTSLAGEAVGREPVRRANAAIRRLARLLVPVNYTRGPGFFHDPAESISALPDLSVALQLPESKPDEIGFITTHLTRGQNRLVAALRDARRTVQEAMA
jgi:hypothetical protein